MAVPASNPSVRHVPKRPWILLLVDDEPDILESVGELVERSMPGVIVLRAGSGHEGLDVLQKERIDGIVADFNMAGMDGLQFLCIAKQCHPTIPRMMLTAHPDPELTRLAREEAAVDDFLPKIIGAEEMLDRLSALLTYTPTIDPAP